MSTPDVKLTETVAACNGQQFVQYVNTHAYTYNIYIYIYIRSNMQESSVKTAPRSLPRFPIPSMAASGALRLACLGRMMQAPIEHER